MDNKPISDLPDTEYQPFSITMKGIFALFSLATLAYTIFFVTVLHFPPTFAPGPATWTVLLLLFYVTCYAFYRRRAWSRYVMGIFYGLAAGMLFISSLTFVFFSSLDADLDSTISGIFSIIGFFCCTMAAYLLFHEYSAQFFINYTDKSNSLKYLNARADFDGLSRTETLHASKGEQREEN